MAETLMPRRLSRGRSRPALRASAGAGGAAGPSGVPLKRRWGRVAVGLGAAIVGMWAFAALYISAGAKEEVLVVRDDVERFDELTEDDVEIVRVSLEPGADSIPASDLDDMVGRRAATELKAGSVLVEAQLLEEGEPVLDPGSEAVPARLGENEFPSADNVAVGRQVRVVVRPEIGAGAEVEQVSYDGWLLHIGPKDEHSGERSVSVVVETDAAETVSAAAADDLVSITLRDS